MSDFIKAPCQHCPYREDVKPFLTAARGAELAFIVQNPYNNFSCHKTLEHDDEGEGDLIETCESKTCAGFLSLQHKELGYTNFDLDGFKPSNLVYNSSTHMAVAYLNESKKKHGAT